MMKISFISRKFENQQLLWIFASAAAVLLATPGPARAENDNALIPLKQIEAPAVDLIYKGKAIDQDQAVGLLKKKKVDLSQLDPAPNDMFGAKIDLPTAALPAEGATIDYDSPLAGFGREISVHRVVQKSSGGDLPLRLTVSTVPHRALLLRALLTRLGYNQYQPKRYRKLTLKFSTLEARKAFVDTIALDTIKEPENWIVSMPAQDPLLTLRDVVLEPGQIKLQNYYWSLLPSNFSEGRRALRALLVPVVLTNVPENIDSYAWDFGRIVSNSLLLDYPREIDGQRPFDDTTIDDARWIGRKILELSIGDWKEIVAQADFPADIAELVLQKIVSKRNQMADALGLQAKDLPFDLHVKNGSVENGQVTRALFDGYASRFTYGETEDPMSPKELGHFAAMQGLSSAMQSASGLISKKLSLGTDGYARAQQQKMLEDFLRHIAENPDQPYVKPITSWGGPVAGFNLNASRQLSTGTAYGSQAPIQLVDTIGFGASVGYFRGIDGIQKAIPSLRLDLSMNRTYTHLRSLPAISEAMKVPISEFLVPKLLNNLAKVLESEKSGGKAVSPDAHKQAINDLLGLIKDGEMFTITDTVTAGPSVQVTIPLQALLPMVPVGFNQGLSFGAGVDGMVVKRTTLRRVIDAASGNDYLQIYVQSMNAITGQITIDFNYWINILHLEVSKTRAKATTRVYTVMRDAEHSEETSAALAASIRTLLKSNSDEKLRANYPYYLLRHDLNESDWQLRFLFLQLKNMEERHVLRIQPPADPEHPFDPKDHERTFYSYRKLERRGSNWMSLLSGALGVATKGNINLGGGSSGNPAYSPGGKAYWTELYTDAEITEKAEMNPVTIARETWAGWAISRKRLLKVFDVLDEELSSAKSAGLKVPLIHREVFGATDKLEFYNITKSLIFYASGVKRLTSPLVKAKDQPGYKPSFLEKSSADAYSASDKTVFDLLVTWTGGKLAYNTQCRKERQADFGGTEFTTSALEQVQVVYGNSYICLDRFMTSVLQLRRKRPSSSDRKAYLEWQTQLIGLLQDRIPIANLVKIAKEDGFFLQVNVKGFRKGDNQAKDSESGEIIASYTSDSLGTIDQYAGAGAFSALAEKTGITLYEIGGLFMTGGD